MRPVPRPGRVQPPARIIARSTPGVTILAKKGEIVVICPRWRDYRDAALRDLGHRLPSGLDADSATFPSIVVIFHGGAP